MNMFDEATHGVLMKFIDNKSKEAEREIFEKSLLSEKHAIPLILKSQFNHIAHLDSELTAVKELMEQRFQKVDQRFEMVDRRFERLEHNLFSGFALLSALITLYRFLH